MDIQRLKPNDIDQSFINELNSIFSEKRNWTVEDAKRFLKNPLNILLLVYYEKELAGFLIAYDLEKLDERKYETFLYEIEVCKKYRRKGIAKRLIRELLTISKVKGSNEVFVLTNESNEAAIALYKSMGGKLDEENDDVLFTIKLD